MTGYEAKAERIVWALPAAAVTGGFVFAALSLAINRLGLSGGTWNGTLTAFAVDGLILTLCYAVGFLILTPLWRRLHRHGRREPWVAASVGGGLTLAIWGVLIAVAVTGGHPPQLSDVILVGPMIVGGAAGAWVGWRIVYHRAVDAGGRADVAR